MTVQSAQALYANRAELRFDTACKLLAGGARLRVATEHSQDGGAYQLRLRIVGTRGERALERGERGAEFVTTLLQRRLQHQDIGHGWVSFYPGCEHGLRIAEIAQIAAEA